MSNLDPQQESPSPLIRRQQQVLDRYIALSPDSQHRVEVFIDLLEEAEASPIPVTKITLVASSGRESEPKRDATVLGLSDLPVLP